jgi:predicted nucleotidyltransferase
MAARIAANHPEVRRVVLFGSFARGNFSARSDIDLLIVLKSSDLPVRERIPEFLSDCSAYPTDVFPLTEAELDLLLRDSDPFWMQVVREGIECYSR